MHATNGKNKILTAKKGANFEKLLLHYCQIEISEIWHAATSAIDAFVVEI